MFTSERHQAEKHRKIELTKIIGNDIIREFDSVVLEILNLGR